MNEARFTTISERHSSLLRDARIAAAKARMQKDGTPEEKAEAAARAAAKVWESEPYLRADVTRDMLINCYWVIYHLGNDDVFSRGGFPW